MIVFIFNETEYNKRTTTKTLQVLWKDVHSLWLSMTHASDVRRHKPCYLPESSKFDSLDESAWKPRAVHLVLSLRVKPCFITSVDQAQRNFRELVRRRVVERTPQRANSEHFRKRLRLGKKKCSRSSSPCPVTTMPPKPSEDSTLPSSASLKPSMFVLSESASLKRLASPVCSSQSSANRNLWWSKGCPASHVISVISSIQASPLSVICRQGHPWPTCDSNWSIVQREKRLLAIVTPSKKTVNQGGDGHSDHWESFHCQATQRIPVHVQGH